MKLTKSDRGGFCWDLAGARRGRPRPLADRRGPGTRPHRGRPETWGAATSRRRGDLLAGGAQTAGDPEVQFTDGQHGDLGCGNLADAWHGDLPDGGVRTAGDLEGQFTDARQPTEASASTEHRELDSDPWEKVLPTAPPRWANCSTDGGLAAVAPKGPTLSWR